MSRPIRTFAQPLEGRMRMPSLAAGGSQRAGPSGLPLGQPAGTGPHADDDRENAGGPGRERRLIGCGVSDSGSRRSGAMVIGDRRTATTPLPHLPRGSPPPPGIPNLTATGGHFKRGSRRIRRACSCSTAKVTVDGDAPTRVRHWSPYDRPDTAYHGRTAHHDDPDGGTKHSDGDITSEFGPGI